MGCTPPRSHCASETCCGCWPEGRDTAEVANALSLSERTIKSTLHAFMNRHQLPNRTAAVAYAMRQGHI
ncbi:LuxR C-terminal-related transcriptional regulator [Streptomyces anulatus]